MFRVPGIYMTLLVDFWYSAMAYQGTPDVRDLAELDVGQLLIIESPQPISVDSDKTDYELAKSALLLMAKAGQHDPEIYLGNRSNISLNA
jgi:hypothetical protein